MKQILCFFVFLLTLGMTYCQTEDLKDKGFDFFMGSGIYFGGKATAQYYSGAPQNENNLQYLFNNIYRYNEIYEIINENNSHLGDSIWLGSIPTNMKYKAAINISLGLKYKFNKNWSLIFNNIFTRLTAQDVFLLNFNMISGNQRNNYVQEIISGKENRYLLELGASYIIHSHEMLKPFFELSAQFTFVKVKEFVAVIEQGYANEQKFDLLNIYGNGSYVPGLQQTTYNKLWGGPGFGLSANVGVKIIFNKNVSIDPLIYGSLSRFGLEGYKQFCFNFGVMVRLVLSDSAFLNKQY